MEEISIESRHGRIWSPSETERLSNIAALWGEDRFKELRVFFSTPENPVSLMELVEFLISIHEREMLYYGYALLV